MLGVSMVLVSGRTEFVNVPDFSPCRSLCPKRTLGEVLMVESAILGDLYTLGTSLLNLPENNEAETPVCGRWPTLHPPTVRGPSSVLTDLRNSRSIG